METKELIVYQTLTGQEVQLSPAIVRKYLVNGEGQITDQEVMMFIALCKYQNLNPFLREAYLIKYGTEKATMVVGKETFLKRAVKNPRYKGHETGISQDGQKAWAKVYVEGYQVPISIEVDFSEYVGVKKDGTINRMWQSKGRTMLKKVALVQALREAFPEDFGGMYTPEEINHLQELPDKPIEMPIEDKSPIQTPQAKTQVESTETQTIITGIEKITMKTGGAKEKPWTKYTIYAGELYHTFNKTFAEEAKKASEIGQKVTLEFKITSYGNEVVNLTIQEPSGEEIREPGIEG